MFKTVFTAALLTVSASMTMAEEIVLTAPMQGASLHTGKIDMAVYYLDHTDHFEVVATYVEADGAYDPARLRMGLVDGDDVSFGLPGMTQVRYRFSRVGDQVTVKANMVGETVAMK